MYTLFQEDPFLAVQSTLDKTPVCKIGGQVMCEGIICYSPQCEGTTLCHTRVVIAEVHDVTQCTLQLTTLLRQVLKRLFNVFSLYQSIFCKQIHWFSAFNLQLSQDFPPTHLTCLALSLEILHSLVPPLCATWLSLFSSAYVHCLTHHQSAMLCASCLKPWYDRWPSTNRKASTT